MSTQLFFSHQVETLAQRLAGELVLAFRKQPNPLSPLTVLVPNNAIKRYLQLRVAEETGITANIRFRTFQDGIGELLLASQDDAVRMMTMDEFRLLTTLAIRRHIRTNTSIGTALNALSYMLFDADGRPAKNFTGRLWHISGQLSYYLTEYEFHRQDMVAGWCADPPVLTFSESEQEVRDMEECQRMLYLALFGRGGLRDELEAATGYRYLTLPQLAAEAQWWEQDKTLFVFGMSQVSSFHRNLLFSLGHIMDLKVFQLNVCSEFWEDITTDREDRWRKLKEAETIIGDGGDEELPWDDNENMLLKWWGKPGRENIRLFSELESLAPSDEGFNTIWLDSPAQDLSPTVLASLQEQVLHRHQPSPEETIPQDRSLQVFGAPGIFREVETIYNSILFNLQEDPTLKQTDIGVLVPDINLYKPAIHAIFRRQPRRISFNLTDASAGDESLYSQALLNLLELATGNFSRKQVFELLRNPCLQKGCGINRDDVQAWAEWCGQLNIFHEFDGESSEAADRFSWQRGLRRLRLGRLMVSSGGASFSGTYPYSDIGADNRAIEAFSLTIEALYRETSRLTGLESGLADWYTVIKSLADRFLDIPDAHEEEASARDLLFSQLRKHLTFEPLFDESPVALDYIRELLVSCIQGIPSRHGSYLSGGVTISAIKANRPVPFQIVYIAGLGEGQFPGQADLSSLNLRNAARKLGDVSKPEEEKFSILETLMGCSRKLYLSYVSKDLQKDQVFYPSSIIIQLLNYVEQFITGSPYKIADVPVDSADERYLVSGSEPECFDLYANYSDYDRLICLESILSQSPERLNEKVLPEVAAWVGQFSNSLDLKRVNSGTDPDSDKVFAMDHRALSDYLDNPLEASLKHRLKIFQYGDDAPDKTLVEDEPFFSPADISRAIVGSVLQKTVDLLLESSTVPDNQQVLSVFDRIYDRFFYESSTPAGVFGQIDKSSLRARVIERYIGGRGKPGLVSCLQQLSAYEPVVSVSIGRDSVTTGLQLPPSDIPLENGFKATLSTSITNLWYDPSSRSAHHIYLTNDNADHRDFPQNSKLLPPFLSYLITLTSQGEDTGWWRDISRFVIHWSNGSGLSSLAYSITVDTANEYLSQLCHDVQNRPFDMLPYSVIHSLTVKRTELPIPLRPGSQADAADKARYVRRLEREVMDLIDNKWSSWYSSRLLKLLGYAVPEDAWDVSNRRFALFHAGTRC